MAFGVVFSFLGGGGRLSDHLLYQVSSVADERIISILRHQNLLKELQEIAAQGTVSPQFLGRGVSSVVAPCTVLWFVGFFFLFYINLTSYEYALGNLVPGLPVETGLVGTGILLVITPVCT